MPELGPVPAGDGATWLTSFRADVAVGLLDGFSIAPTVGGVLSLDLLASAGLVSTAEDAGFAGGGTLGNFGIGIRVGVFRESFSLPGVTLSATRRWVDGTSIGGFGDPGGQGAEFDHEVTSLRAVVGKELYALGLLAGVGWERHGGDAKIQASSAASPDRIIPADDVETERVLFFGGASYNFLVFQIAAEGGWARGLDAVPGRLEGGFDPEEGSLFGSLSLRLVF
jgi:hypothetical protein